MKSQIRKAGAAPGGKRGYGGVEFIEADDRLTFTSGSGITARERRLDGSDRRGENFESVVAAFEKSALDVLRRAGIEPHGVPASMDDSPENYAQRALAGIRGIRARLARGDGAGAAADAVELGEFKREAELKFAWEAPVLHGQKFKGRKPGSGSPIRKAIARLLANNPKMENPELWARLGANSGWRVYDNRVGKYIEALGGQSMNYRRFRNVASEERARL